MKLHVNKTKMLQLTRAMGYDPPQNAGFIKEFREQHWWLVWDDGQKYYQAALFTAAGAVFSMRCQELDGMVPEKWEVRDLSLEDLRKFDLAEERAPKAPDVDTPGAIQ